LQKKDHKSSAQNKLRAAAHIYRTYSKNLAQGIGLGGGGGGGGDGTEKLHLGKGMAESKGKTKITVSHIKIFLLLTPF
jgi:hypothetical protein